MNHIKRTYGGFRKSFLLSVTEALYFSKGCASSALGYPLQLGCRFCFCVLTFPSYIVTFVTSICHGGDIFNGVYVPVCSFGESGVMKQLDRYVGCLLGLAVGDALGTTLEFKSPGTFEPLSDMVGGGPFGLLPGQWTDDTSMALCLAESLLACGGFDARDQMTRYVKWWREGHLSATGVCFDIGVTVQGALRTFEKTGDPFSGSTDPQTAGNGSIMRLAPVPLFYAQDPEKAIHWAAESSKTTHGAKQAVDACRYLAGLIVGTLEGRSKDALLASGFCPVVGLWDAEPLEAEIQAIAAGSFKVKNPPDIQGSGYVVRSLEAALWAFYHSHTFEDGALLAVNLGDDADTTGAVYGQLAGAFYGVDGIPVTWREKVAMRDLIEGWTAKLMA